MSGSVCIICGYNSGRSNGGRRTRGGSHLPVEVDFRGDEERRAKLLMEEFYRELGGGGDDDLMDILQEEGEDGEESWTLCLICVPFIERAMGERRRCKEVEERVNKLQRIILEELRCLMEGVAQFQVELEGVKEMMGRVGNDQCQFDGGREGDGRMSPPVESVRKRVFGAVRDLHVYQSDMERRMVSPKIKMESLEEESCVNDQGSDMEWNPDGVDDYFGDGLDEAIPTRSERLITPQSSKEGSHSEEGSNQGSDWEQRSNSEDGTDSSDSESSSSGSTSSSSKKTSLTSSTETLDKKQNRQTSKVKLKSKPREKKVDEEDDYDYDSYLSRMSNFNFKEQFITKALRDQKNKVKAKVHRPDLEYSKHLMEYDDTTEKLTLGGVQVIVIEGEEEEESNQVRCGSCPFTVTWSESLSSLKGKLKGEIQVTRKMAWEISAHIHAVHLDTFKCHICNVNKSTRNLYVKHMDSAHGGTLPCDICGKFLKNKLTLSHHKWTHMNEEEKAVAIQNGGRDFYAPSESSQNLELPCSICGKLLKSHQTLKAHEKAHSGERDMVICPICGKMMLKTTYQTYHRRFVCPLSADGGNGEHLPVQCIHCPTLLKNHKLLKKHIQRFHSTGEGEDQRPWLCTVCGKGYKANGDLQLHMRIHQEEKLWRCNYGCGREFNVKRNWKRHEESCKKKKSETGRKKKKPKRAKEESEDETDESE